MDIIAENHSMYPRVGESDHDQRLREAHHSYDHGEIDADELREVENSYIEEIIEEQQQAGLDVVTDGMIRWYDHISHLCSKISGVEVGGLVRYFDTNYLVREGEVRERLDWTGPMLVDGYEYAASVADSPVKVILTGPHTMSYFSDISDNAYPGREELAEDYAEILRREVEALQEAGVKYLQLEEPRLLQEPSQVDRVLSLVDTVLESANDLDVRLTTYFGDATPVYEELQDSAADVLGLDLSYGEGLLEKIVRQGSDKRICFGALDGRNTKLAEAAEIADEIAASFSELPDGEHSLSFTSSLDYLPKDRAKQKLNRLAEARDQLREVL